MNGGNIFFYIALALAVVWLLSDDPIATIANAVPALALPSLHIADHTDVVAGIKSSLESRGVDVYSDHGSLMIAARVAWTLRAEGCGLHMKAGGSNIAPYHGEMVGISRVMYPNGQLYKILIDCPTTNGPEWADDGPYPTSNYRAVNVDPDSDPDTL